MPSLAQSQRLRVIGQELEKRKVVDFEVFSIPDGYRVKGELPPPEPVEAPPPPRKGFLGGLFSRQADESVRQAETADPQPVPWAQEYTSSDIERLDAEYRARRKGTVGTPDDYGTSQILRVIGAFVEQKRRTTAAVTRKGPFLKISHQGYSGEPRTDSYKYADLYDFAQGQFRARGADPS